MVEVWFSHSLEFVLDLAAKCVDHIHLLAELVGEGDLSVEVEALREGEKGRVREKDGG